MIKTITPCISGTLCITSRNVHQDSTLPGHDAMWIFVSIKVSEQLYVPIFRIVYDLKKEAVGRTELLVLTYIPTRHIPIVCNLHHQHSAKFALLATKLETADTFPPYVLVFHMQSHSEDDELTHAATKAEDSSSLNRQDRHQIPFPGYKGPSSTVRMKVVDQPTKLYRVTSYTTFTRTVVRT